MKNILFTIIIIVLTAMPLSAWGQSDDTVFGHDVTFQLVNALLTSDGVQYSAIDTTTTLNVAITAYEKTITLDFGDRSTFTGVEWLTKDLIDLYFNIVVSVKAVSTGTADISWKSQARNQDGTWTDLTDYILVSNPSTVYTESVRKGYMELSSTLNKMPIDFRILVKCNETDEGIIRIVSGSFIRVIFKQKQ